MPFLRNSGVFLKTIPGTEVPGYELPFLRNSSSEIRNLNAGRF
jgi:hypothetical protein